MMPLLSSLSFSAPWVLLAFITLPILYWFLKVIPPKPRHIQFPAIRLLLSIQNQEQSSRSIPWWLLALRLTLAALIIFTLAGPRLNAGNANTRSGPMVVLIDNNWQIAPYWNDVQTRLSQLIEEAKEADRLIALFPLAAPKSDARNTATPQLPATAATTVSTIIPRAVPLDRSSVSTLITELESLDNPEFFWISSGMEITEQSSTTIEMIDEIETLGPLTIYQTTENSGPHLIRPPKQLNGQFSVPLSREVGSNVAEGVLIGKGADSKILFRKPYMFEAGKSNLQLEISLPVQLTNQLERLEIENASSAASIYLLDNRWRRPEIGLVTPSNATAGHMLLDERHYIEKALLPNFTVKKGELQQLLTENVSFIALPDTGRLPSSTKSELIQWIENGGTLIRFAGPQLAAARTDLTPVQLRIGNRNLDGSISWTNPARLGPMPSGSPFTALEMPNDIVVRKQVLAIPSPDLNEKTWARLNDGTPLVTADQMAAGNIILFHTTASTAWSNLALSGLFVEMLREIGTQIDTPNSGLEREATLPPIALLDGRGAPLSGSYGQYPLSISASDPPMITGDHPAGYYGDAKNRYGLNVGTLAPDFERLDFSTLNAELLPLKVFQEINLRPALLTLIFALLVLDLIAMIFLQGKPISFASIKRGGQPLMLLATIFMASTLFGVDSNAEESEDRILAATLQTRLAYITTGDQGVDKLTKAGMEGISQLVSQRTSVEVGEPMGIDLEEHELLFYPFVYWPITSEFPNLSDQSVRKVRHYMANGGTLLIDTRNQIKKSRYGGSLSNSPENQRLQSLMSRLDIPRLTPVPVDHVLTRAFYLMQAFPGRYADGEVWISDTSDMLGNDGVSPILIGSNDWAAAWAINETGRPIVAVTPGGARQRELARRFGINMVMYTLTGSYKSDQVHIPAILERLGQ